MIDEIRQAIASEVSSLQRPMQFLAVEIVLAALIYLHYRRFASSATSHHRFALILPFVGLTTFLVISTVKSSFSLSLGLVGALSIVRFRTPIKDPEELSYIYLAIASGIGLAAGQAVLTGTVVLLILVVMTFMKWRSSRRPERENLFVSVDVENVGDVEEVWNGVDSVIRSIAKKSEFLRYEMHGATLHVTLQAQVAEPRDMSRITGELRSRWPDTNVSFIDESNSPA